MDIILGVFCMCFLVLAYFTPGIIASWREAKSANWIAMINLFFGWTLIAWVALLIWAVCGERKDRVKTYFGKSTGWK